MRRRSPFALALSCSLAVCGACRDARPWAASDWRPAEPPRRVVAASLLATEVLLAIAPHDRIAGVHVLAADARYSLVTAEAKTFPLVGAEPEQLLASEPDLVICDAYTRAETLALLASASVPVVVTANPASFDDIAANVRRIGRVCHLETPAEALVATMQERLRALAAGAADVGAWRVANLDGGLHSHGRGSLFDAVVAAVGARNVAAERGAGSFRKLDVETLLGWNPDALVVSASDADTGDAPAWMLQHRGVALLPCVVRKRLVRLPGPLLTTTSHRLVEAAELVQKTLRGWGRP